MTTTDEIMALADTYADGPHMDGYYGSHRSALRAAIEALQANARGELTRAAQLRERFIAVVRKWRAAFPSEEGILCALDELVKDAPLS
jgi:Arc/MetJ-type ribon-helix-helix transcriptional regulator